MKPVKFFLILISLFNIIIYWSCIPEPIEIKIDPIQSKIVVASQIIPGQLMFVALTRSFGALDLDTDSDSLTDEEINQILVSHALVTISYSGRIDTLFQIENGLYMSIFTPQYVSLPYTLYVYDSISKEEVTATTVMLPIVKFLNCIPEIYRQGNDTIVSINIELIDPPEENWYMLNYYRQNSSDSGKTDLNSFFSSGSNQTVFTKLYSDRLFEGDTISGQEILWGVNPTDTLIVTLSNISEEYFNFLDLRNRSGNFFSEITNEAINYPSNVINGYGFFNTHFPDIRLFDLNKFEIK